MPLLLQLRSLGLSVGSSQLLDAAEAQLADGQRVALTGPNGCGKSTLLQLLAHYACTGNNNSNCNGSHKSSIRGSSSPRFSRSSSGSNYFTVSAGSISSPLDSRAILLVGQDQLQWTKLLGKEVSRTRTCARFTVSLSPCCDRCVPPLRNSFNWPSIVDCSFHAFNPLACSLHGME